MQIVCLKRNIILYLSSTCCLNLRYHPLAKIMVDELNFNTWGFVQIKTAVTSTSNECYWALYTCLVQMYKHLKHLFWAHGPGVLNHAHIHTFNSFFDSSRPVPRISACWWTDGGFVEQNQAALWKACIYLQFKCCLGARKSAAFSPAVYLTLNDHTSLRNNYLQSSATKPSAWWIDLHRRHECVSDRQRHSVRQSFTMSVVC